jgi:hemerythrin superfamily protein
VVIKKKAAAKPLKASAKRKPSRIPAQPDAIAMLRADHKLVEGLFADYAKARSMTSKKKLVAQICAELTMHAKLEAEIFYPAFKHALKDTALVPEAAVEHAAMTALIADVEHVDAEGEMGEMGEMFEARMKVLSEYVRHHVKEEQNEMFPKAKTPRLDLEALGREMAMRKAELLAGKTSETSIDTALPEAWLGKPARGNQAHRGNGLDTA